MRQVLPLILAIFVSLTLSAQRNDGRIFLQSRVSGVQEVPAVNTAAKGLFTVFIEEDYSTITVNGIVDSLSGPITICHIHDGVAGVSGPVIISLTSKIIGNRIYGKVTGVSKANIKKLLTGGAYFNVHTAKNPGGEIRGQIYAETDLHFVGILTGSNEIPATTSTGFGLGSFVLSEFGDSIQYKVIVNNLTGPIVAAHLHVGNFTESGKVLVPLSFVGNVISGSFALPASFFDSLVIGSIYVNVHTAANAGGEIRSQLSFLGYNAFEAQLSGAQETPAVTSNATALMVAFTNSTLDSLTYYAVYSGLTPIAAHFHTGAAGTAGPVLFSLAPYQNAPNTYVGLKVPIDAPTMASFLKTGIYTNMHTTANPGGEIRGQMIPTMRDGFIGDMCGGQENPPTTSAAIGLGSISVDRNKSNININVVTNNLSSNALYAHIHKGAKGASGPVVIGFGAFAGNQVSGYGSYSSSLIDSFTRNLAYFNVHTVANPGGEIRGQIGKQVSAECLLASGTFELNGKTLKVVLAPNPTQDLVNVNFESNEALQAHYIISDFTGRTIAQKDISVQSGANQIGVNLSNLSNGIYFIQMRTANNLLFTEKVIKQ